MGRTVVKTVAGYPWIAICLHAFLLLGLLTTDTVADPKTNPSAPGIAVSVEPTMVPIFLTKFKMGCDAEDPKKEAQAEAENRNVSLCSWDSAPKHTVELRHNFEMSATEVTQEQWVDVMGHNPSYNIDCGPTCPVEQVSWLDAVNFANQLSAKKELEQCYVISGDMVRWPKGYQCEGYRLPTEAEWEGTARAPKNKTVDDRGSRWVNQYAWLRQNSNETTHPVATRRADLMGLYDIRGNVSEWTWDAYGKYKKGKVVSPMGSKTNKRRVYRGGSAFNGFKENTRTHREHWLPAGRDISIGFRLARSID